MQFIECCKIDSQRPNGDCVEITRQAFDFHYAIYNSWTYDLTGFLATSYEREPIKSQNVLPGTAFYELVAEISKGNSFSGLRCYLSSQ